MLHRLPKRLMLFVVLLLVLIPAVMAISWIGTETVLQETADAEFCGTCHGYFSEEALDSCVSCHAQVGHKDLRAALAEHFDHVPPEDAVAQPALSQDAESPGSDSPGKGSSEHSSADAKPSEASASKADNMTAG